jgi:hypothetical protein
MAAMADHQQKPAKTGMLSAKIGVQSAKIVGSPANTGD